MPATRRGFWRAKFAANVDRDRRTLRALKRDGWRVLVIWECQTRDFDRLCTRLAAFLSTGGNGVAIGPTASARSRVFRLAEKPATRGRNFKCPPQDSNLRPAD